MVDRAGLDFGSLCVMFLVFMILFCSFLQQHQPFRKGKAKLYNYL